MSKKPASPASTPVPVQHAKAALEALAAEDAALAAAVSKTLPGYAVRLAQQGQDTSVAALTAAARRGPGFLKEAFAQNATPRGFMERYTAHKAALNPPAPKKIAAHYTQHVAKIELPNKDMVLTALGYPDPFARHNLFQPKHGMREVLPALRPRHHAAELHHKNHHHQKMPDRKFITKQLDLLYDGIENNDDAKAAQALLKMTKALNVPNFQDMIIFNLLGAGRLDAALPSLVYLSNTTPHTAYSISEVLQLIPPDRPRGEIIKRAIDAGLPIKSGDGYSISAMLAALPPAEVIPLLKKALPWNAANWQTVIRLAIRNGHDDVACALIPDMPEPITSSNLSTQLAQSLLEYKNLDLFYLFERSTNIEPAKWLAVMAGQGQGSPCKLVRYFTDRNPDLRVPGLLLNHLLVQSMDDLNWFISRLPQEGSAAYAFLRPVIDQIHTHTSISPEEKRAMLSLIFKHPALSDQDLGATVVLMCRRAHNIDFLPLVNDFDISEGYHATLLRLVAFNSHEPEMLRQALAELKPTAQALTTTLAGIATSQGLQRENRYQKIDILINQGADRTVLPADVAENFDYYSAAQNGWQRTVRQQAPKGLYTYDPKVFKPVLYKQICDVLVAEGYQQGDAAFYAYAAVALFQSEERIWQYFHKWAKPGQQPLHNLLYNIKLPTADLATADLNAWGDAVLKHGPEMAGLVKFCLRIPAPLKSDDGESWSLVKTRALAAQFTYVRGQEHPDLAALCVRHKISENAFEQALQIVQSTPLVEKNIPDITIDGAQFNLPGTVFKRLPAGDIRGLFLGELTACCQSIGGHGAPCARHGYSSPDGGFYVIETDKGEIIGQSWAWRGTKGELCLDSLEMLQGRVSAEQWKKLATALAREISAQKNNDVTALHIGTAGETPASFANDFRRAAAVPFPNGYPTLSIRPPATTVKAKDAEVAIPRDYNGYRDSKQQYVIWRAEDAKAPAKNTRKTQSNQSP